MKKARRAKFVFLDRDGVINVDTGMNYVKDWKKFRFLPGSLSALRLLKEGGYKTVVISNQAGIAKGLYTRGDLRGITRRMKEKIRASGGRLDAVYYCPHERADGCSCRKPKTALFRKARRRFGMTFKNTVMIGDSMRDIAAGKAVHSRTILVLSGKEKLSRRRDWEVRPDFVKKNLLDAVRWLLRHP